MSAFEPHARTPAPVHGEGAERGPRALGPAVDADTSALLDFRRFGLRKAGGGVGSDGEDRGASEGGGGRGGALVRRALRFVNCGETPFRAPARSLTLNPNVSP